MIIKIKSGTSKDFPLPCNTRIWLDGKEISHLIQVMKFEVDIDKGVFYEFSSKKKFL